jgi:hypothetical protein
MSKVTSEISMSLDGFIAGPNVRAGNGMGDGGDLLHDWMFDAKCREAPSFRSAAHPSGSRRAPGGDQA